MFRGEKYLSGLYADGMFREDFLPWNKICTQISHNFAAGRDGWVIPSGKMPSGLYIAVRPEGIFRFGRSQSPGPILISRQVFVLARNRYNSGSSLYFVRGGSEIISSDAVQNGKSPEITTFSLSAAPTSLLLLPLLFLPSAYESEGPKACGGFLFHSPCHISPVPVWSPEIRGLPHIPGKSRE